MIVQKINIKRISNFERKNNMPVTGYGYTPIPFQLSEQGVKPIARLIEIRRMLRFIQMSKYACDPSRLIGADAARVVVLKKAFQTFMPERIIIKILYRVPAHVSMQISICFSLP